jgi:hypothetical protein
VSVTNHEIWRKISGYLKVDIYDRDGGHADPRIRIGFVDLPDELSLAAQWIEIGCVECARPVHPLRRREGDPNSRLYYAPCCLIAVRIACSRGPAVRREYDAFKDIAKRVSMDPRQLSMF